MRNKGDDFMHVVLHTDRIAPLNFKLTKSECTAKDALVVAARFLVDRLAAAAAHAPCARRARSHIQALLARRE